MTENHDPLKVLRIGISLLLVNTDESGDESVSDTIHSIFTQYREKTNRRLGANAIADELYHPVELELFGTYDKLFVFLQDDSEFINQYLHPQSTLLKESNDGINELKRDVLFRYKTISGSFSEKKESDETKIIDFITEKRKDIERLKTHEKAPVILLSRIKIGTLHLIHGAGKLLQYVKKALEQLKESDQLYNQNCHSFILIESFGFHELVLLTTWKDFHAGVTFLKEARELLPSDLERLIEAIPSSKGKKNPFDHSVLFRQTEPVFDLFSTSLAFDINFKGFTNEEKRGEKENIDFYSVLGIRPGATLKFREAIREEFDEPTIKMLLGWKDYLAENIFSSEPGYRDKIAPFFEVYRDIIDNRETVISFDFKQIEEHLNAKNGKKKDELDIYDSSEIRGKYIIKQETILRLDKELRGMGINQAVIQRAIHAILNFNKSISDRENFVYFLSLYNYIYYNLIQFASMYHILIREDWQNNKRTLLSSEHIEVELIKIIKGFETAFSNRYIHSRELSEISDTNYAYRGGIQQYLLIFEYLLTSIHKMFFGTNDSSISLYVTGYSKTVSTSYSMRMNIFQVYNPGLFLVILSHEVVIHLFQKIISAAFLDKIPRTHSKVAQDFLSKLGLDDNERLIKILQLADDDKVGDNPFLKILKERLFDEKERNQDSKQKQSNLIKKYHFTDLITLEITFFGEKKLFIYWHLIYFFQLFGVRPATDSSYTGELHSFILRLYLIFKHESPNDNCKSEFKKIIKTHLKNINNVDFQIDLIIQNEKKIETDYSIITEMADNICQEFDLIQSTELPENNTQFEPISRTKIFDNPKKINEQKEFDLQRKIGFNYLNSIYNSFKYIFVEKNESLFQPKEHQESTLIIGQNGGLFFNNSNQKAQGLDKVEVFNARMDFYQRLWHLSQLSKKESITN